MLLSVSERFSPFRGPISKPRKTRLETKAVLARPSPLRSARPTRHRKGQLNMPQIQYSEKYYDDVYEYR